MSLKFAGKLERPGFTLEFDLDLPAAGMVAVCGASGAGKTTLLRCLAGLEPGFHGVVRVGPRVWQDQSVTVPLHHRALGYVFQSGELFPHLDVAGNLRFAWDRTPPERRIVGWDEVVDLVGLKALLPRRVDGLSGGERQRVALGRALLRNPDLLLLDEPLASLDATARRAVYPLLERVGAELGTPTLCVTHSLDEAARLADRLILLDRGRVVGTGLLADLLTRPAPGLAQGRDAGAVVRATVTAIDPVDHIARLDFAGGQLAVADPDLHRGDAVRLRVHARDVSLTLAPAGATSILNVLPAVVDTLWDDGPGRVMVRLLVGETVLLSAVTARSAGALGLAAGGGVWAQIKSVALL